jgi:hypothetical protein
MSPFALRELKYGVRPCLRRRGEDTVLILASREQVGVLLMVGLFVFGPVGRPSPIDRDLVDARTARERVVRLTAICQTLKLASVFRAHRARRCRSKAALRGALPTGPEASRAHPVGLREQR